MIARRLLPLAAVLLLLAAPAAAVDVEVAVLPPGCADPWQRVLIFPAMMLEPIARRGGQVDVVASGPDALAAPGIVVFPDARATDAVPGPLTALPGKMQAHGDVDVLETPFERVLVLDPVPGLDVLTLLEEVARKSGGRFPDVVRKRLPLLRGMGAVAVETDDPPVSEVRHVDGASRRETVVRYEVHVGAAHGTVVAISRSLGGPARVARELTEDAPDLVLHAGGARDSLCTEALTAFGVDAVVPRAADLASGLAAPLPYVAANLVLADGPAPWPSFRILEVHGKRVGVVGLVGRDELTRAPGAVRASLRLRSGRDALADTVAALRRAPEGPPDLIVALSSGDGAERAQLVAVDGVDLVIADFSRDDGLPVSITVEPRGARERSRHNAALAPVFHRAGLGRITFALDDTIAGRPELRAIRADIDPLLDDGGHDEDASALAARLRAAEDDAMRARSAIVLPAVRDVASSPAADALVHGERLSILGEMRHRAPTDPPIWTDDLWLRVVGNSVLDAARADVALVRNMRRPSPVTGPLSRGVVESWLTETAGARVVEVPGADLSRLAERLAALPIPLDDTATLIAAVGLDSGRKLVGARPIDPLARYRVVVDERLVADPRLIGIPLDGAAGEDLGDLVVRALADSPDVQRLVEDRAQARTTEWRLGLQTLELRGSAVQTSEGLRALAPSLETRAQQRDLLLASARLHAFALLDGPAFAWDTQLRAQYDATFFTDGGPGPPVIEPFDDVVASTEVRAVVARVPFEADAWTLSPFVNGTVDGEVTPAPLLRRQLQLRESAGLALYAAGALRELRLGGVVQQDAADLVEPDVAGSADKVHVDAGLTALVHITAPLAGPVVVDSVSDARFFFPDGDDRSFDLALRAQSVTRLSAPLTPSTSAFVFVDVVALSPKPSPAAVEWNVVMGAGLAFGGVLRL